MVGLADSIQMSPGWWPVDLDVVIHTISKLYTPPPPSPPRPAPGFLGSWDCCCGRIIMIIAHAQIRVMGIVSPLSLISNSIRSTPASVRVVLVSKLQSAMRSALRCERVPQNAYVHIYTRTYHEAQCAAPCVVSIAREHTMPPPPSVHTNTQST